MKFKIEQIALYPMNSQEAIKLLDEMGAGDWAKDHVIAEGKVFGTPSRNGASLNFEYEMLQGANELEVLNYVDGPHWLQRRGISRVSHLGMHCTETELDYWKKFFAERKIAVAQEVKTKVHSNPHIAGKRWYKYVIFDTYLILGVDIKLIVRLEKED